jgi:hypothetical protein
MTESEYSPEIEQELSIEEQLVALSTKLGFVETDELRALRNQITTEHTMEELVPLIGEYQEGVRASIDEMYPPSHADKRASAQVAAGLMDAVLYRQIGETDYSGETLTEVRYAAGYLSPEDRSEFEALYWKAQPTE